MRLEIIREIFLKELRETLRDRRTLAVMFGIPLLLYPLLTMSLAGLTSSTVKRMEAQATRVAVVNDEDAPELMEFLRKERKELAIVDTSDPRQALEGNRVDAVVRMPHHFQEAARAARDTEIVIQIDSSRTNSGFSEQKVHSALDAYGRKVVEERLRERGVPPSVLKPLRQTVRDIATADRRLGSRMAALLPMLLLITGMLGAFFPAIAATTAERELGTLEALLVTPAGRMEILVGKTVLVVLFSLVTAGLNLLSMSLVLWRTFTMLGGPGRTGASAELTLDPLSLLLSYAAAVPTLLFCSAAVMVVGLFARNYREANSYTTPVMLLSLVPVLVSATDPKTTPALLATPIVNTTLVIRDVLTGHATPTEFALAFGSSCLFAILALALAARVFTTENLVNPAWEPLSLKGFRPGSRRGPRRLPALDEALAIFAVQMMLLFYLSPEFMRFGLIATALGNQILMIAAPALLAAWLGRYRWRETFSWRSTSPKLLVAGALLGLGAMPWIQAASNFQNQFWKPNPEVTRATLKLMLPALMENPLLTALVVGISAGICEEILYRGPLQSALARRLSMWPTLLIGGSLFAAAHLDLHGFAFRMVLGILLGWLVLRGGSLFPVMVLHFFFDFSALLAQAWVVQKSGGVDRYMEIATSANAKAAEAGLPDQVFVAVLGVSLVLLLAGFYLCHTEFRKRSTAPKPLTEA